MYAWFPTRVCLSSPACWNKKNKHKNTAVQTTRAGQEITARFMKWSGSLKATWKLSAVDLLDRVHDWRIFLIALLKKGKTSRTRKWTAGLNISTDVLTWLPLEGLWRGVGWGWGGNGSSNRASNPPPPLPVLPACPGRPSSCLLSGDSVQPTVGCVEGAQRDQLKRMVPTQNPRRGNGVGWVGEWGVSGTYPSCMAPSQRAVKTERRSEKLREVGFIFITVADTTHRSVNVRGDVQEERQRAVGESPWVKQQPQFGFSWRMETGRKRTPARTSRERGKRNGSTRVHQKSNLSSSNSLYSSPPTNAAMSLWLHTSIPPSDTLITTHYICMWASPVVSRANLELRAAIFSPCQAAVAAITAAAKIWQKSLLDLTRIS